MSAVAEMVDGVKVNFLKYTARAYRALPPLDKPRILDVGCGRGVPTVELAKLSGGEVVGIDIDGDALEALRARILREGLGDRVRAENRSLFDIGFGDGGFDIVWTEGAAYVMGFARALREWRRLVRPSGFMVFHDAQDDLDSKLAEIEKVGYRLIDHFTLPLDVWRDEYYRPLLEAIGQMGEVDMDAKAEMDRIRAEAAGLDTNPERYKSAYFIIEVD